VRLLLIDQRHINGRFMFFAELNKNVFSKRLKEAVYLVDLSLQGSLFEIGEQPQWTFFHRTAAASMVYCLCALHLSDGMSAQAVDVSYQHVERFTTREHVVRQCALFV